MASFDTDEKNDFRECAKLLSCPVELVAERLDYDDMLRDPLAWRVRKLRFTNKTNQITAGTRNAAEKNIHTEADASDFNEVAGRKVGSQKDTDGGGGDEEIGLAGLVCLHCLGTGVHPLKNDFDEDGDPAPAPCEECR